MWLLYFNHFQYLVPLLLKYLLVRTNLISPLPSTILDPFPPVLAPPTSLVLLPVIGLHPSLPLVHARLSPLLKISYRMGQEER
jgi:hypothetical protein